MTEKVTTRVSRGTANSHVFDDRVIVDGKCVAFANEPWASKIANAMAGKVARDALVARYAAGVEAAIDWLLARAESQPPAVLHHAAGILARQMQADLAPQGTAKLSAVGARLKAEAEV